jgi:hypothetical protein
VSPITVSRPAADEYGAFFSGYVQRVADLGDALHALTAQDDALTTVLGPLDDTRAQYRYAPEKWSVKELLGHITDAERVFAYRLLRIGRGDLTPLPGFDENAYVEPSCAHRRALADLLDEWSSVRRATITLVRGMPADAWPRRGTCNGHPLTARALLYVLIGHVDHHLGVLQARYGIPA